MARVVIVGCGCRGLALARSLRADGHAVRGTSRDPGRRAALEAEGVELHVADPDRIATLTYALDGATLLCWLLGSARGDPGAVAALHGSRLEMLLARTIDTTVRGFVYEAAGSLPRDLLAQGEEVVREACARSEIPWAAVRQDPRDHAAWLGAARLAVDRLLLG